MSLTLKRLKITHLKSQPHLPGCNELTIQTKKCLNILEVKLVWNWSNTMNILALCLLMAWCFSTWASTDGLVLWHQGNSWHSAEYYAPMNFQLFRGYFIEAKWRIYIYMYHLTRPSLVQIMAWHLAPSHYLNQCWNIVNWNLRNRPQWNINRISYIFIQENLNAFQAGKLNFFGTRPNCVVS